MELKENLKGVYTILITPFKDNYDLDLQGLNSNINHCIECGVHGVVVGGSLGEFSSLTMEERRLIIKEAIKATAGRVPLVACTAHSCLKDAIELTEYAKEEGADGVMMTAPYFCHPSEEGILNFFKEVNDAVDIDIVLYNTFRAGVNLTPEFISQLADIPHIVGIKQGSRNMNELINSVGFASDRLAVMAGNEEMMLGCYSLGMVGTTGVTSGFLPNIFLDVYHATQRNQYDEARNSFYKLWEYFRIVAEVGQPAVAKETMRLMGLAAGPMRLPMVARNQAKLKELKGVLNNLGML